MNLASVPSILAPNLIAHFYPGSGAIARFRGLEAGAVVSPEDWVGSATKRYGHDLSGLSRLEDGGFLADAIVKDPVAFLGPDHVEAFGVDTGLLVKLLDPGERLIVHSHPDRTFANRHLGCAHGKTEAWIVLSESPGEVFLGFDRQVAEEELAGWVASQSIDEMLGSLNTLSVSRGDAVLVPAGIPHAIGAGVFAVELQEPTDFSFALEHRNFTDPDLRLGWDLALSSVDRSAWPADRLARLAGPGLKTAGRVLPAQADPFFRADLVVSPEEETVGTGFAVLVVLDGSGEVVVDSAPPLPVSSGVTVLLPYGAGPARLTGDAVVIVCRPPVPGELSPARPAV